MAILLLTNTYTSLRDSNISFGSKDLSKLNKCKILVPFFNKLLLLAKNVHPIKVERKQPLSKFFIFIDMYALYNNAKRTIKFHSSLNKTS